MISPVGQLVPASMPNASAAVRPVSCGGPVSRPAASWPLMVPASLPLCVPESMPPLPTSLPLPLPESPWVPPLPAHAGSTNANANSVMTSEK
jgi:hypothetical protein